MGLQLSDRERPRQFRAPTFATRNRASDLGLVHSLRSGETAELIQIKDDDRSDDERDRATLDPNDEPACFQGVDRALNKFFATRHILSVRFWL